MSVVLREREYAKIIEKLITLRKQKGWSQAEVAKKLNTHQSRISRIENCETQLDVLQLKEFARLYNISLESLF